jgi:RecA-family ATPase
MTALDIALDYVSRGWCPVPVEYRSKKPSSGKGWPQLLIDATNAPHYFNSGRMNVGVMLGPSSHGLTDVDLDCEAARAVAPYVLPRTGAIFGRASSRAAHRLYYTDLSVTSDKAVVVFNDPATGGRLLELRIGGDSGVQTVFPGSIHEEGEQITWEESGEPASVDGDDLARRVHDLAAYALIARHWPAPGLKARHNAALIIGGFLARTGMEAQNIKIAAEAIAKAANDTEWRNRREAAEDAAKAFHGGKHAYGLTSMRKQFGDAVANQVAESLGYDGSGESKEESQIPEPTPEPTPEPRAEKLPPLPFINMSNWDNEPTPEQEWVVPDRIPLGQTSLFTGEGGYGKSTVQLHLCAAHALGRDWLKTLPEPGPSIFFEAEDGEKVIHRRLAMIAAHYTVTFADMIRGGLHVISMFGHDAVLATPARNGKIEPTPLYRQLLQAAGDIKPKMIGIASSANVFTGSELDRTQTQQFIGLLNRLAMLANGAVVLIAHPSLTGINTDTGLSGTTQWHNAVRARFYLKGIKTEADEQPNSDLRELVFKKNQFGPLSTNIVLRYRNGLFMPEPSISGLDKIAHEAKADEVFLGLVKRFASEERNVSHNESARTYAPIVFAKEDEAQKYQLRKADFEAAMRRLFEAKKIHNENYGRPSRPYTRIIIKEPTP